MSAPASAVSIVIQTGVRDDAADEFGRWESRISAAVATFPGFIEQNVMPPNPPLQADWVILQRFTDTDSAVGWLHSDQRMKLVQEVQPMLAGPIDVHLVHDDGPGVLPAPVSAVISTRIKPGQEGAYRKWEQRIVAAQSRAAGFQGYRLEPPVPGVQDDWLAILRFDSEAHLQAWLGSPTRQSLLEETADFMEAYNARVVRTGFEQWFPGGGSASAPAAWKQNMVVVLLLYPVVFLFGIWVANPYLIKAAQVPFPVALFIGNVVSVTLLSFLVPWASRLLGWWLTPKGNKKVQVTLAGAGLVIALYAACIGVFLRLS